MLAIIKTGGKQYLIKEGSKLKVEKLEAKEGDAIKFSDVLLADGADVKVGTPLVAGASVEAKVLKQGKADKISVVKYKPKTRYKRTKGHRQRFTEVQITKINA
jgi:large subunit ribosomal protein L21